MTTRLRLKHSLLWKSWVDVDRRGIEVVLWPLLREPWRVEAEGMAVVDLGGKQAATPVVYEQPLRIPTFRTGSNLSRPTTALLFDSPRRLAPMRKATARQVGLDTATMTPTAGPLVDGIALRFADPAAAVEALAAAGATVVPDQDTWFAGRRRTLTGARGREVAARRRRTQRTQSAVVTGMLLLLFGARIWFSVDARDGTWNWWPAVVALVAVALVSPVVIVLARRSRR